MIYGQDEWSVAQRWRDGGADEGTFAAKIIQATTIRAPAMFVF